MPEKQKEKQTETEVTKRKIIRSGDGISIYSNYSEVGYSSYDFRMILSELEGGTQEEVQLKTIAKIHLSPQHAKALIKILESKVKQYEEEVGPIGINVEITENPPL